MAMSTARFSLVLALLAAPAVAHAATYEAGASARGNLTPVTFSQSGFVLRPTSGTDEIVVIGSRSRRFTPESRQSRAATGARFGDGEIQYVEGPAWNYRTSWRGPLFEVAALGGGIETAPYLAHVAMNWQF